MVVINPRMIPVSQTASSDLFTVTNDEMLPPPGVHDPMGAPPAILTYASGANGPNGGLAAPRALPKHVQSFEAIMRVNYLEFTK